MVSEHELSAARLDEAANSLERGQIIGATVHDVAGDPKREIIAKSVGRASEERF